MSINQYPEHKHPHELLHKEANGERILVCTECRFYLTDVEYDQDTKDGLWGHLCEKRGKRCESHMEMFQPCPPNKPRSDVNE